MHNEEDAVTQFLAGNPQLSNDDVDESLPQLLQEIMGLVEETWPILEVPPNIFLAYLAKRVETPFCANLEKLAHTDLYLVCSCREGDPTGLKTFRQQYLDRLDGLLGKSNIPDAIISEVKSDLASRLFVPDERNEALIDGYKGTGSLHAWIRVVATRDALRRLRKVVGHVPMEEALAVAVAEQDRPDVAIQKLQYQKEFRTAFAGAMEKLSSKDRKLLREHYLFGLNIDKIGALHGVHRATAARWLAGVREFISSETRMAMLSSLNVGESEYDSIIRMIESQLDVSVGGFLKETEDGQ